VRRQAELTLKMVGGTHPFGATMRGTLKPVRCARIGICLALEVAAAGFECGEVQQPLVVYGGRVATTNG
jgi:hypothetical protein